MRNFFNSFSFIILLTLLIVASVALSLLTLVGGFIYWIIPLKTWRRYAMQITLKIPTLWTSINNALMWTRPCQWEISYPPHQLSTKKWYLLIANHQTWLDILVLGYVFNRKTPIIKFFMKKELLWSLPLVGLGTWILGYPFMQRHSKAAIRKQPELRTQDIDTAKKACQKFSEFPTTVMNFIEGTRFSEEKRKRQHAPFNYLLKPKAGGIAIVLQELQPCLQGILNVTIHYSEPHMTFLKFFFRGCKKIKVHADFIPVTPDLIGDYYKDREYRKYIQQWLNARWQSKDLLLADMEETV